MGLNYATSRPRQEILGDYVRILERIYEPAAFAGRLQNLAKRLDNSGRTKETRAQHSRHRFGSLDMMHRIMTSLPEPRDIFRHTLSQCMSSNPDSIRWVVALMALYLHVGPFSREVIAKLETMIAALEPAAKPPVRIERASVV
jgi:hypothetical protein